jgi:oxygen-independent coproporphyrinogen-3 oxidase
VIGALIAEMEQYELGDDVKTIYIGGGSPSCLPQEQLLRIVSHAVQRCPAQEEFTIEVNPGQVNMDLLCQLHKAGVNRLSIGAQSFIPKELDFLGRNHTAECTRRVVRQARAVGFENVSLDLIFAVPGSCLDSWKYNLQAAIELLVDHISAYGLTYEGGTALERELAAGVIEPVDEDTDRAMYELTIDELERAGITQYEISNFARGGFECRHNLNYWANGDYIGIGPGAASYRKGARSINFADIHKYTQAIAGGASTVESSETLIGREFACETAVLNLRRRFGIDVAEFESRTGFDPIQLFAEPIQAYQQAGLIESDGKRIFLTRPALAIADSILCDFALV